MRIGLPGVSGKIPSLNETLGILFRRGASLLMILSGLKEQGSYLSLRLAHGCFLSLTELSP